MREAQLAQYNYILVVGAEEAAASTVNVRTRDNQVHGMHTLDDLVTVLRKEKDTRSQISMFEAEKTGGAAGEAAAADGAAQ